MKQKKKKPNIMSWMTLAHTHTQSTPLEATECRKKTRIKSVCPQLLAIIVWLPVRSSVHSQLKNSFNFKVNWSHTSPSTSSARSSQSSSRRCNTTKRYEPCHSQFPQSKSQISSHSSVCLLVVVMNAFKR